MKLLGEYLREMSFLTTNQLVAELRRQCEMADKGKYYMIGQLLVESGHISAQELDEAVEKQQIERSDEDPATAIQYWVPRGNLWESSGTGAAV